MLELWHGFFYLVTFGQAYLFFVIFIGTETFLRASV